jgi:hypothetical protein
MLRMRGFGDEDEGEDEDEDEDAPSRYPSGVNPGDCYITHCVSASPGSQSHLRRAK